MPDMSVLDDILAEVAETAALRRPCRSLQPRRSVDSVSSSPSSGVASHCSQPVTPRSAERNGSNGSVHADVTIQNGKQRKEFAARGVDTASQTFPRRHTRAVASDADESDSSGFTSSAKTTQDEQDENQRSTTQIPCPFGTFLNLDFVHFCSGMTRGKLPESIRLFRKASSHRKKKWRKSMDQMLYSQEALDNLQTGPIQVDPICNTAVVTESRDSVDYASELVVPQNLVHRELEEAVETFEETWQHHFTHSKKKKLSCLDEMLENEDQASLPSVHFAEPLLAKTDNPVWLTEVLCGSPRHSAPNSNNSPCSTLSSNSDQSKPSLSLTIRSPKLMRESLFTVPDYRTPKSALNGSQTREVYSSLPDIKERSVTPVRALSFSRNSNGTVPAEALESIREKLAAGVQEMQKLQREADQVPLLKEEVARLTKRLAEIEKARNSPLDKDSSSDVSLGEDLFDGNPYETGQGKVAARKPLAALDGDNGFRLDEVHGCAQDSKVNGREHTAGLPPEYRRPSLPSLFASGMNGTTFNGDKLAELNGVQSKEHPSAVARVQHILEVMTRRQNRHVDTGTGMDQEIERVPSRVFCDIGIQSGNMNGKILVRRIFSWFFPEAGNHFEKTSEDLPERSGVDVGVLTELYSTSLVSRETATDDLSLPRSEAKDFGMNTDPSAPPRVIAQRRIKITPQKMTAARRKFQSRKRRKLPATETEDRESPATKFPHLIIDIPAVPDDEALEDSERPTFELAVQPLQNLVAEDLPAASPVENVPGAVLSGEEPPSRIVPEDPIMPESGFPHNPDGLSAAEDQTDVNNLSDGDSKQPSETLAAEETIVPGTIECNNEQETCSVHSPSSTSEASSCSVASDDEGSYDLRQGRLSNKCHLDREDRKGNGALPHTFVFDTQMTRHSISKEVLAACKVLNDYLHRRGQASWTLASRFGEDVSPSKRNSLSGRGSSRIERSVRMIEEEWFAVAGAKEASALMVNDYLDAFEAISKPLLHAVVNLTDVNGNTVLHYALSHNNFDVVSVLLDSKVCDVDIVNKAGYTTAMLASLANMTASAHQLIAARLFHLSDINRKAQQHGQTALMLAVSHGRLETVRMLLQVGADVNIQDNDGSTALMCASEHGHLEIVRMLLYHPDMDPHLADQDGMCALYVALEAGHKEVAALIYAKTTTADMPSLAHSASGPELAGGDADLENSKPGMLGRRTGDMLLRGRGRSRFGRGRGKGTSTM